MNLLVSASFIASFLAGVAALFAPCCITVLLPTYFASIFKQKTTVFLMTFIYFLGLLTIFLPLGLGATFLTRLFSEYHDLIFILGSIFLIFLGMTLLSGQQFSLPFSVHPELKKYDFLSVYILGIFSAVSTICCAPVLAGVLTLSVLPGSYILGGIYTLAYVLGMVIPLFIIAGFLDKVNFTHNFFAFKKTVNYSLFKQTVSLSYANLFSGVMFVGAGMLILFLAKTGQLTQHSSYQLSINISLTQFIKATGGITGILPEAVWAVIFFVIFLIIIYLAVRQLSGLSKTKK